MSSSRLHTGTREASGNPEADFRRFILYIIPNDRPSQSAHRLAAQFTNQIYICNILSIPKLQRPTWVNGVPTLVDNEKQIAYRGSEALKQLEKFQEDSFMQGIGSSPSGGSGHGGHFDATTGYGSPVVTASCNVTAASGCTVEDPFLDDEKKYTNSGKVDESAINLYVAKRGNPANLSPSDQAPQPPTSPVLDNLSASNATATDAATNASEKEHLRKNIKVMSKEEGEIDISNSAQDVERGDETTR